MGSIRTFGRTQPSTGISHMAARAFADDGLRARRTCVQERRRAPRVSRNEWCERVTPIAPRFALDDAALARLVIVAAQRRATSTASKLSDARSRACLRGLGCER